MKIGIAFGLALLAPAMAFAATPEEVVTAAALSKTSEQVTVNGVEALAVYIGDFNHCQSVSIVRRAGKFIDNYRVCDGEVKPRNTVSPAWDENVGKRTLLSVVNNAIDNGKAQQNDDNGYLISARIQGTLNTDCRNIEVIVSYDGDLVDRAIHQICENQPQQHWTPKM